MTAKSYTKPSCAFAGCPIPSAVTVYTRTTRVAFHYCGQHKAIADDARERLGLGPR